MIKNWFQQIFRSNNSFCSTYLFAISCIWIPLNYILKIWIVFPNIILWSTDCNCKVKLNHFAEWWGFKRNRYLLWLIINRNIRRRTENYLYTMVIFWTNIKFKALTKNTISSIFSNFQQFFIESLCQYYFNFLVKNTPIKFDFFKNRQKTIDISKCECANY